MEVSNRLSEIVMVPVDNFEYLQMLKYERTQYYGLHHDLNAEDAMTPCGVCFALRLLCLMLW